MLRLVGTVPVWVWAASAAALLLVVAAELVLTSRPGHEIIRPDGARAGTARRAAGWAGAYLAVAALCGLAIGVSAGWVTAGQFFTGYLTEYSLSLDNLVVFAVIMAAFAVPPARQPRVLLLGIGLALVMRAAVIVAGAAALNRFGWLFYPLAAVLLGTAVSLVASPPSLGGGQGEEHTRLLSWLRRHLLRPGRRVPPAVLLAGAIGLADVLFAADSISAVFGITTTAVLVLACNVFALMGLRQLYVLVTGVLGRMPLLNLGLAVTCAFVGAKLLLQALNGSGVGWAAVPPPWLSVLVIAVVLAATVLCGLVLGRLQLGRSGVLERRFAVLDANGNGVLDAGDCQVAARRLGEAFGYPADSAAARAVAGALRALFDRMLAHMDANGDQVISREEFLTAAAREFGDRAGWDAAAGATARTVIRVAGTDGSGVLDPAQYTRLAAVYGLGAEAAARSFGRLDLDRNGVLDAAELGQAISQFFVPRGRGLGRLAVGHG